MSKFYRYCIEYTPVVRGGVKNPIIMTLCNQTLIFENESEMLKKLAELKEDICIKDIVVSVVEFTETDRRKYKI